MPAARAAKMPTPAVGSVLNSARITASRVLGRRHPAPRLDSPATSTDRPTAPPFNAAGAPLRLRASPLFGFGPSAAAPALRRGALVAVPVGAALLFELGTGAESKGAIATGALFVGFTGLDAPALTR